jgi:hypothetical protein
VNIYSIANLMHSSIRTTSLLRVLATRRSVCVRKGQITLGLASRRGNGVADERISKTGGPSRRRRAREPKRSITGRDALALEFESLGLLETYFTRLEREACECIQHEAPGSARRPRGVKGVLRACASRACARSSR